MIRSILMLREHGMPLVRDDSDKPHVTWSVPKDWAPGGVLFAREQTPVLLRAPDPQGAPGALYWNVAGSFDGSEGTFELVYNPETDTVLHFLFRSGQ